MKSFCIKTLGCKVNQYESQVIREGFMRIGYLEAEDVEEADICVINTCTVTSNSDSESLRLIRNTLRRGDKCVVATGCMVESSDLDLSRLIGVRFIVKNRDKYRIPEIVRQASSIKHPASSIKITAFKGHTRVFVKIQDGCNNTCSYCKVRIVRGRSRSRSFDEIVNECTSLIRNGSNEIVLTGICLGAYGRDLSKDITLCKLISKICKIDGNWRLRLSSIEPKDIDEELVYQIKRQDKICKHLHIPFQSGDDYILRRMNRPYNRNDYIRIVNALRDAIADISISTDIMVGFPGEREQNFQNTVDFVNTARPMRMHIFPFSRRNGTRAYYYKDNISATVMKEREDVLRALAEGFSNEFANRFIGKKVDVLLEDKKTKDGYLQGYSDRYIKVYIDGPDTLKGNIINCHATLTNKKVYGILPAYFS